VQFPPLHPLQLEDEELLPDVFEKQLERARCVFLLLQLLQEIGDSASCMERMVSNFE